MNHDLARFAYSFLSLAASAVIGVLISAMVFADTSGLSFGQLLLMAVYVGLFSLGLPCLILASAFPSRKVLVLFSLLVAGSAMLMTFLFAIRESSTSVFIFLYGIVLGVPAALVVVVVTKLNQRKANNRSG